MTPYHFRSVGRLPVYKTPFCYEHIGDIDSGEIMFFLDKKVRLTIPYWSYSGAENQKDIICHVLHSTKELIGYFRIGGTMPVMYWFEEATDDES